MLSVGFRASGVSCEDMSREVCGIIHKTRFLSSMSTKDERHRLHAPSNLPMN